MNIHDCGENDPIPFELGSWKGVADKVRDNIELRTGREITHFFSDQSRGYSTSWFQMSAGGIKHIDPDDIYLPADQVPTIHRQQLNDRDKARQMLENEREIEAFL